MLTKIRTTWHPSKWRDSLKTDIQQVRGSSKLTSSKACSDHLPPFDQLTNMPIYFILKPLPLNLSCAQFYVVWNTLATGKAFHLIGINMMIKKPWGEYPIARYMGRLNWIQINPPVQDKVPCHFVFAILWERWVNGVLKT